VDVKRAADLYTQGWTLRQIGAELGVHWSAVSQQLQSAGVAMRSGGAPAHPASTQQNLASGVRAAVADQLGRAPTPGSRIGAAYAARKTTATSGAPSGMRPLVPGSPSATATTTRSLPSDGLWRSD
jgi:acetylornithine deacetylase/succinyl-diaminopimelate desuccinylase-like protein